MKKSTDSIDRLTVKQLTLESKKGSIVLSVGNDGKINFLPYNKNETGSFSIDLKNEKIVTKKLEFIKDNSSFTSSLDIGSGGSSISDQKFDPSTGRLIEEYLPDAFSDVRENAINAIGKFDGTTGKLNNIHINQDIKDAIDLGVSANVDLSNLDFVIDQTNPDIPIIKISRGTKGITSTTITKNAIGLGNVLNESPASIRNGISIDIDGAIQGIGNGSGTKINNSKITIDSSTGKLIGIGTSDIVVSNSKITVDSTTGKLVGIGTNDVVVNNEKTFTDSRFTTVQSTANNANSIANINEGRFSGGKLLETNLESTTVTKITNGNSAHNDLNTAEVSIDATGKIQFNRGGSRGLSAGTTITKSHIGLPLAENKSVTTIIGETFADTRFLNVSASSRDGFASGSAARGFFDNSETPQLKDSNTPSILKNSNISLSLVGGTLTLAGAGGSPVTFTKTTVGLNLVENKNVATIKNETFADTIFTSVQSTANTANSTANTINNRFDTNARIKEDNSLNKRPIVIQYGSPMPASPQIGDLATVIGDGNFVGTTYMYGTRSYDLGQIPGDFGAKDFLSAPTNKTTTWSSYQNPYFTKTSSGTGVLKFQYRSNIIFLNGYSLYISPNSSIVSVDRFYGQTKFIVNCIPVTGTTYFTTNYEVSDVNNDGASGDPALYFSIETSTNTFTNQSVYDSVTNNLLGTAVSDWDGTFINTNGVDYKSFYFNANSNSFYRYRILHNNITDATTTRRILVDKVTIEGWIPYDDTGVKSRLYELADLTSQNFSTFTGQHKCAINDKDNIELYKTGFIVSSAGTYNNINYENSEFENKITPQEAVPVVTLCNKKLDKSVIGVVCKEWEMSKYNNKNFKADGLSIENNYIKRLEINSLGEGGIWVCNINGNLENGDYITSCEISGYGMKQDDDLLRNYTVAKITCDCDFNLSSSVYICEEFEFEGKTYRRAFVGCTYHCG